MLSHTIPTSSAKLVASSSGDIAAPGGEGQGVMGSKISRLRLKKQGHLLCNLSNSGHVIICFLLGQLVVELIQDYSAIFKDLQHFGGSCFDFTYLTTNLPLRIGWIKILMVAASVHIWTSYLVECTDSSSVSRHWNWRHYIRMNFVRTTWHEIKNIDHKQQLS